jgi:hypothetical protein
MADSERLSEADLAAMEAWAEDLERLTACPNMTSRRIKALLREVRRLWAVVATYEHEQAARWELASLDGSDRVEDGVRRNALRRELLLLQGAIDALGREAAPRDEAAREGVTG